MNFIKSFFIVCASYFLPLNFAHAAEGEDWQVRSGPVTQSGPGTPVAGNRYTLGAVNEGVEFIVILDSSLDMMRGNWYGHIRSSERFYAKVHYINDAGRKIFLEIKDAKAIGPDSDWGIWKKGPATADVQVVQFDFTRDQLISLRAAKSLIVNYASFETPDDTRDIIFPMDVFDARLAELDASIQASDGSAYLMTTDEVESTPIKDLPPAIQVPIKKDLTRVSNQLSVPLSELTSLTIPQLKLEIENKKSAMREAARAAKEAEYQAIYDQEPDWMDLNVCPKPDVSFCDNVGLEAYDDSILFGGDFSYGKIEGVVWRSEKSIVRIYGGDVDLGIEPEIYRAKAAKYYYIVKNAKGRIDIRSAKGMLIR